jgi:hypothetical protein
LKNPYFLKGKGSVFLSVPWHCPVVSHSHEQTDNASLLVNRGEEAGEAMHAAVDDVYLRNASIVSFFLNMSGALAIM